MTQLNFVVLMEESSLALNPSNDWMKRGILSAFYGIFEEKQLNIGQTFQKNLYYKRFPKNS